MIKRYKTKSMNNIWNFKKKLKLWINFQIDVCESLVNLNIIPLPDFQSIKKNLKLNINLMKKLEKNTKHDVIAFIQMLSINFNNNESRWLHYGLTSTDMVDSVQNLQIKFSNKIIIKNLKKLQIILKKLAFKYKLQLIMGRSHGMFGEPTSLGLKFALWYEEINRHLIKLKLVKKQIEVIKITGSMGNFVHISPKVSEFIAKKWKMKTDNCATQVIQRDRFIFLITQLSSIANTIEKIALEIRLSQRNEVNEILENFTNLQKGSSSMPHKKNPIGCENICGLARLIRSYNNITYENNLLWYERDISHSSNERIFLPDIYHLLNFIIIKITNILDNLIININEIYNNINKTYQIYFSQVILLAIIKFNSNITREKAYDFIQKCSWESQEKKINFKNILIKNNIYKYLTKKQLDKYFNNQIFLINVDYIFTKVFNDK